MNTGLLTFILAPIVISMIGMSILDRLHAIEREKVEKEKANKRGSRTSRMAQYELVDAGSRQSVTDPLSPEGKEANAPVAPVFEEEVILATPEGIDLSEFRTE